MENVEGSRLPIDWEMENEWILRDQFVTKEGKDLDPWSGLLYPSSCKM